MASGLLKKNYFDDLFKFGNKRVGDVNTLIQYFGEDNVVLLDDYLIEIQGHAHLVIRPVTKPKSKDYLGTFSNRKSA